jgi:hypothetical protein
MRSENDLFKLPCLRIPPPGPGFFKDPIFDGEDKIEVTFPGRLPIGFRRDGGVIRVGMVETTDI